MKRKPVKTPHESIHKVMGRVVATAIRDGYGLDWAEKYRNLPSISVVEGG